MEHLKKKYNDIIKPALLKSLNLKNIHEVPRISKIVINRGLGEAALNSNVLNNSLDEISLLAGQRGVLTRSKKAIAAFKLRSKIPIGVSVVLRDNRMYAFLDRFISLALPRIRDFHGVNPENFDGVGNYSVGLDEQLMFPEIDYNKIDKSRGMTISIITTAKNDDMAFSLLKEFNMPFSKNKKSKEKK